MIFYRDVLTGDILFTDDHRPEKANAGSYQIKCADKTVYSAATGVGQDRELVWSGLDIIGDCSLVETGFSKKDAAHYFQDYFNLLKSKLGLTKEQLERFDADAEAFEKTILRRFSHYQIFLGQSCNIESTYVFLEFKGDEAFATVFEHGVERTDE
ncbi:hypothetical protein BGZ67_004102 [Mortierella alpina]|nr:hypothetical protein BGZ67_004102 [Mortierella alpina]